MAADLALGFLGSTPVVGGCCLALTVASEKRRSSVRWSLQHHRGHLASSEKRTQSTNTKLGDTIAVVVPSSVSVPLLLLVLAPIELTVP